MHSPIPVPSNPPNRRRWLTLLGLAPLLQACSPLRLINATVPSNTHTVLRDEAYGPAERQRMDVYQPVGTAPGAPMAVFFYGGSWSSGERADYKFVGEALASRGIVTVIADYRLSPEVRYPVFLQDCALAVRWARDNAQRLGASPSRLFVSGHSAGAYNAAMLALDARWLTEVNMQPAELAGWAGLAGPYDFLPIGIPEVQLAFNWPDTPASSQPLFHAPAGTGLKHRVLLLAAKSDTAVNPQRNTMALAQALQQRGTPVELELFDRVNHVTLIGAMAPPLRGLAPVLDRLSQFLLQRPT
ncbi:MAG: alpha/beta hydrolase [Hydrogenophaga sp.]|uniref:alpha/beta hydrolase n=1 Tax=Hydrogenophaga sp. TaxID=1904254 RepID=UPI002AB957ED|nr:alpha/beta hydrolase [Hydrogenophaga sp.]MDZ4101270.1 alpha/beta hydrolase [Hydrogenophaga sp.]